MDGWMDGCLYTPFRFLCSVVRVKVRVASLGFEELDFRTLVLLFVLFYRLPTSRPIPPSTPVALL